MLISGSIIVLCVFIGAVKITDDYVNLFVLSNISTYTITFIFPLIAFFLFHDETINYLSILFSIIYFVFSFIGYAIGRNKELSIKTLYLKRINYSRLNRIYYLSLFINIIFIIYLLMNYGFEGTFISSRTEIYMSNRKGAGHIYYLAATFLMLYFLTGLFVSKNRIVHLILCFISALPYGNKTRILAIFFSFLVYLLVFSKYRAKFNQLRYLVIVSLAILILVVFAFWFTSYGINFNELFGIILWFGGDYQVNFTILSVNFDSYFPHGHYWGRILIEDNILQLIPRIFWENKPLYFGSLDLAQGVFPAITELNIGAPSFGPFGQAYADFGFWGLIQIGIQQYILGFLLGKYEVQCIKSPNIISYLFVISIGFGGILGIGGSLNPLFITFSNILFINFIFLRFHTKKELSFLVRNYSNKVKIITYENIY